MQIIRNKKDLQQQIRQFKQQPIVFVPTMGNLHQGHLELVQQAHEYGGITIVSIFVNPMQFNDTTDLQKYPRTLEADIAKLRCYPIEMLFCPDIQELYPADTHLHTRVVEPQLSQLFEGHSRPGHFDGVCTIVLKLFHLIQPDIAIFGEKDYQQLQIIKKMVQDLDLNIRIASHPTVREADGLAMSSRNQLLSADARRLAPCLYQVLLELKQQILRGTNNWNELQEQAKQWLNQQQYHQARIHCDYLAIVDATTLQPAGKDSEELVILAAIILDSVRLIDNITITRRKADVQ